MSAKLENTTGGPLDGAKWGVALVIVAAAITAFYYYADQSLLLRVVGLLAAGGIAVAIILQTEKGRAMWAFTREARTEVRKVVWPTRKETLHTTGIVFLMVTVIAIFLWLLDMFLGWAVRGMIGGA
jgi:preprotein translocase subunit SecE